MVLARVKGSVKVLLDLTVLVDPDHHGCGCKTGHDNNLFEKYRIIRIYIYLCIGAYYVHWKGSPSLLLCFHFVESRNLYR